MNDQPAATPVPKRRWRLIALGVLLAVVGGLVLGEATGWPFLAKPLQRMLSDKLDRRVSFAPDGVASASRPTFGIRFIGGLRLQAAQLYLGAPTWSAAPHLLLARDVTLDMRYIDLWRAYRGEPMHIERLRAALLDAELERLADGRASWQFAPPPAGGASAAQPLSLPRFGSLQVVSGTLRYRDVPLAIDAEARLSLADSSLGANSPVRAASGTAETVQPTSGLQVKASGHYRELPLKIELASSGVLPWVADDSVKVPVPLTLNATVGRANLIFKGSATDALNLGGLNGRFSVKGPSLADVGDPVGVTLPTTGAFRSEGRLVKQADIWRVVIDDATVGASRLNGAFSFDAGRRVPMLSGRLKGSRLLLADLGPVVGTTTATAAAPATALPAAAAASVASAGQGAEPKPKPKSTLGPRPNPKPVANTAKARGKVLPDRPFDLAALRAMDANVLIDISDVDLNTRLLEPVRPLHGHLQLSGGVLTLRDLDARTADGRLTGALRLDGRGTQAIWNADVRWDGVRLERWVRQKRSDGAPPYVSGRLNGQASLQGQGRSTAEILASLKGRTRTQLRDGAVSHLAIEAAGLDLAQSLGVLIKGDDALPVQCAVADLQVEGGVFRPRLMVVDTTDSAVWVDGSLSLKTETLDLRAVVSPKDFSPLTLRTPLRVSGSFANPEVSLDKGPLGRKLAASLLLALFNPLAALIPLIDPGDAEAAQRGAAGCPGLAQRRGAKPAAAPSTKLRDAGAPRSR